MIYYVRKNAASLNLGNAEHPFTTISQAAEIAKPGDTVMIGEGVYREWVSPRRGGNDESTRITYKSIDGENVVVSGAEEIHDWVKVGENLYKTVIAREIFGEHCPYETEIYGDWYNPCGQIHHTGEVFADGEALYEAANLESIEQCQKNSWFSLCSDSKVTIWVYMKDSNPANHKMEISARPFGFFPEKEKINYITISGLTIENVATQWAPPTAFQAGAVGTHWSKGWIIENCTIRNSKCVGISVGKRREDQDNRWTRDPVKGGAQTYTEVIFSNLKNDWSKENVGSHIIRGNTIYNCGQAGIVGCMGGAFSTIENNHIFNINMRGEFGGAEVAGIKLHAGIDVLIRSNMIHDSIMGLWIDWEGQGVRVSRNIFFQNSTQDIFIEVCHGPAVIDNNLLLSATSFSNNSQGTALVHNLITGAVNVWNDLNRFTMYHFPHETAILGSIIVYGGDDRILNNVYIGNGDHEKIGNMSYNNYSDADYLPDTSDNDTPMGTKNNTLGMYISGNAFFCGAKPCVYEKEPYTDCKYPAYCRVVLENGDYILQTNLPGELFDIKRDAVTTELLGCAFESGAAYENRDGTPLVIDEDIFGNAREVINPCGPFAYPIAENIILCSKI